MSEKTKSVINAWLPALLALAGFVGNGLWFAKWTGEMEMRLVAVECNVRDHNSDLKSERFVHRSEYLSAVKSRDTEMGDLKQGMHEINTKLDALLTRNLPFSHKTDQ